MATPKGKMTTHHLKDDGVFPNNSTLPAIIYQQAIELPDDDPALTIEQVFKTNRWLNAWRNGIYDYHHYHSTAHEVLGVYQGQVTVQLGGPGGITATLKKGDMVIIPAGVAHKNLQASEDFKCVGAYPDGRDYDTKTGKDGERPEADENIRNVPLPVLDPIYGKDGPLISAWTR